MSVRVRFAPSPSGPLHLGNVRTALFNWLFARTRGGQFLLRIEDTDPERSSPQWESAIVSDLSWLGLSWDEGPVRQSGRLEAYRNAAGRLLAEGSAYYCFCTPEELEAQRQEQIARGLPPRYDGRCRSLRETERTLRVLGDVRPAVRFRMPEGLVLVSDLVRGEVSFQGRELGDFIILRGDGRPAYNLAAVVDDGWMRITHVIRGDDHLANTPRQMVLARALGVEPPAYAHLPLIVGKDGSPLSKRHGAVTVAEYRESGILPEALVNYLALLGWSPPSGQGEVMDEELLVRLFSMDRVSRAPGRFDPERLAWFNRQHLRRFPVERFLPEVLAAVSGAERAVVERALQAIKPDVSSLREMVEQVAEVSREPSPKTRPLSEVDRSVLEGLRLALREASLPSQGEARALLDRTERALGVKRRVLMQAIRMALTGRPQGLPVATLLWVLGPAAALRRIDRTLAHATPMAS
jgi:glutamyl-tRNA synthetase